jgi:tetratricopeptide (TPR) repeat protein
MLTRHHLLLVLICIVALTSCCEQNDLGKFIPKEINITEVNDSELMNLGVDESKTFMELKDESLTFIDYHGVKWVAPRGTLTDGATIPQLGLSFTKGRFAKEYFKAAVVHDAYCQEVNQTRTPKQYRTRPWQKVHRMFYEASLTGGTEKSVANAMYLFVWLGGPRWDDPGRDLQNVSDEMLNAMIYNGVMWLKTGEPAREEIETWMDKREPALLKISQLESTSLSALREGNQARADAALVQAEEYLRNALDKLPNDVVLLNLKGILYKNRAIEYRQLDMDDKVKDELDKAERTFQKIITIEPQQPSALNGLGRVWDLRNDLHRAEVYFDKALEIDPGHPAAKLNRERIIRRRLHENHP